MSSQYPSEIHPELHPAVVVWPVVPVVPVVAMVPVEVVVEFPPLLLPVCEPQPARVENE